MQTASPLPEGVRHLERSLNLRVAGANGVGALLAFLNLSSVAQAEGVGPDDIASIVILGGYLVVAITAGSVIGRRIARPLYEWVLVDRAPTRRELRMSLAQPWWQSLSAFGFWCGAAVIFGGLNLAFDPSGQQALIVTAGILVAGVAAGGVTFLLVERLLRPVFALALARSPEPQPVSTLGFGPRLMLSWALAAAIPLVSIAILLAGGGGRYTNVIIGLDVGVGLVVGWLLMRSAAGAVADPLEDVRRALRGVREGDLESEVAISDGGEIGFLQVALNRMVEGLRERQRLADLFGRHVGEEVARRALAEGASLGGERREASALFVDVIGSTAFAYEHEPEEVVERLNAFFSMVVRCVDANGGWVNKFEGDGALCIFGAPEHRGDHATRALRTARELREQVGVLAASFPGLDAAVGVSSGSVIAANVGATDRLEYTVIGDPVNEAARLTDQAKSRGGRVLASESAVRGADPGEACRWREAGSVALRGRGGPTTVLEPSGA